MKFVHAADLHIDSPMRGLDRYEGAPAERLRGATRRALENLVQTCIDERAAFLLLAGDVFDGSWKDYSTGLFFAAQMTRLRDAKIPVVIVRGNHDAASSITKALRLPDNVRELGSKKPETIELADAGVAVHGQSFAQRVTTDDLAQRYPNRVAGAFNIGLLHTCLDGREGHEPYAPTTVERMRGKGYDYWALGHIHAREVISRDPWIVFPGNLQARHVREPGSKGASLVTVEGGVIESVEHRALDVARFGIVEVDASSASDPIDVVDLARAALTTAASEAEERVLAARIVVRGATRVNAALRHDAERFVNELRATATDAFGDGLWVEKVKIETRSIVDRVRLAEEPSAVGHLVRRFDAMKDDPVALAELAAVFADLEKKLPAESKEGEGALALTDPSFLRGLLDDAEQTLLSRLLESRRLEGES